MRYKKRKVRKSRALVLSYLERISSQVFSEFPRQLTDLVANQQGVYALYKGDRLYYVGLAANLRNRIKQHLRDRHAGKWHKFSLYLVRKADQIRELESLVMRIADPTGNATRGQLPRAQNLRNKLQSNIRNEQERQLNILLGSKRGPKKKIRRLRTRQLGKRPRQPTLAPHISKGFKIQAVRKGKVYSAGVRSNGRIYFGGKLYNSPSAAAKAALGYAVDGWHFWCYKTKGQWVLLKEIKKK